jgi:hypothetical protein
MHPMNTEMMRALTQHRYRHRRVDSPWDRSQPGPPDRWLASGLRRLAALLRRAGPSQAETTPVVEAVAPTPHVTNDEPTVEIAVPDVVGVPTTRD